MEKLVELLNEYEKERWTNRVCYWVDIGVFQLFIMSEWITYRFSYVISKEYWFIKWLVENEKIDFSNIDFYFLQREQYTKTESLLMLLAIQDNPIEFLISILK
jgi:hypothetical protein